MTNAIPAAPSHPADLLIQKHQFAGWLGRMDFERAVVLTHDTWKARVKGIPQNGFLLAGPADANPTSGEIFLLRVSGAAAVSAANDAALQAGLEQLKHRPLPAGCDAAETTGDESRFGLVQCRVLGTFYLHDGRLRLGSDVENFPQAAGLAVYRPEGAALEAIANYISPERLAASREEAKRLGLAVELPRFPIGTVRFASADRLHRGPDAARAVFSLNAVDFLSRRTAVFGMTRTGKSNTVKQLVSVVNRTSRASGMKIGQIIYDLNGEYANANQQDQGALAEVLPQDTIRYRMIPTPGFELILNNFFHQVSEGHNTLRGLIESSKIPRTADLEAFLAMDFTEPRRDDCSSDSDFQRQTAMYQIKLAAYRAVLARAGFELPEGFKFAFEVNAAVRNKVNPMIDPAGGMSAQQAFEWFYLLRQIQDELITATGSSWVEPDTNVLINLLLQKSDQGGYIPGFRLLQPFKEYHAPSRTTDVCDEIYSHLLNGKIVIIDLSVGDPALRERLSKRIARHIFYSSMAMFNAGKHPAHITFYIEEAHNLIGHQEPLTEIWPAIAKEGAKARLGLVYATQEVSSIRPNILANTENIIVSHLNNRNEIAELAKYYDFGDFADSLIRAQDVGFARIKTLSNPFVIPVQIDRFDPATARRQLAGG
jgi:hypothetical protein